MQDNAKRKLPATPVDPWVEAGRRMPVPDESGHFSPETHDPETSPDNFTQP